MKTENVGKYPTIHIDKCPNCGSTRKLAGEVLEQQIKDGKLPKESSAFIVQHQSVVAGPVGTWLSAPCIISFLDICVDCGTLYCVHADVVTAVQGGKNIPGKGKYHASDGFSRS